MERRNLLDPNQPPLWSPEDDNFSTGLNVDLGKGSVETFLNVDETTVSQLQAFFIDNKKFTAEEQTGLNAEEILHNPEAYENPQPWFTGALPGEEEWEWGYSTSDQHLVQSIENPQLYALDDEGLPADVDFTAPEFALDFPVIAAAAAPDYGFEELAWG